ncbi:hypothetical protein FBG13_02900 [Cobetia marina]|uniref:hypothetical protein n=1 Tax=Cobetia marina TaxID=28258 RepID=UPI0010AE3E01|nr:hypothetical protein [Cobetia marina]TKD64230.1 hypothetical protein FBG13_02900 [Cobetia marina]
MSEHQLPDQILANYDLNAIGSRWPLVPEWLKRSLPPLIASEYRLSARLFAADYSEPDLVPQVEEFLESQFFMEDESHRNHRMSHCLHYTVNYRFTSLTDPRVSSIRKLLRLIFCQPRRTVRRGSAIKYYTQILELRKALKRLLNWGDLDDIQNSFPRPISPTLGEQLVPPPEHFSDADLELLEQFLHAYDKATDRPSEHPNHLRNKKATRALLDEIYQSSQLTRSPIRKQHRARNENQKRRQHVDTILRDSPLWASDKSYKIHAEYTDYRSLDRSIQALDHALIEDDEELTDDNEHQNESSSNDLNQSSISPLDPVKELFHNTLLSQGDQALHLESVQLLQQARSLKTSADISLRPQEEVLAALRIFQPPKDEEFLIESESAIANRQALAFLSILLCSGIAPERLLQTTVISRSPKLPLNSDSNREWIICQTLDQIPSWSPEEGLLHYSVNKAPTETIITLPLPNALNHSLMAEKVWLPGAQPFKALKSIIEKKLKRWGDNRPGSTLTLRRVSASHHHWVVPACEDEVIATWLRGELPLSLSAPATYRTIPLHKIQKAFLSAQAALGLFPLLEEDCRTPREDHTVGSTKAQEPSYFKRPLHLLTQLTKNHAMLVTSLITSQGNRSSDLRAVGEAIARQGQILGALTLLAWQLCTLARPIGSKTQCEQLENTLWLRDKDSARAQESRQIPLVPALGALLRLQHEWREEWQRWWKRHGGKVDFLRHEQVAYPVQWKFNASTMMLTQQRLQHADWRQWLKDLPTFMPSPLATELSQWGHQPSNITRHSMLTALQSRLSHAEFSALAGHTTQGHSLQSPASDRSLIQSATRSALTDIARLCGLTPDLLHRDDLPWPIEHAGPAIQGDRG